MKKNKYTIIIFFILSIFIINCKSNSKNIDIDEVKLIEIKIQNAIQEDIGNFELIDSSSVFLKGNIKEFIWLTHNYLDDKVCNCNLFVYKWNNKELSLIEKNNFLVDCSSAMYNGNNSVIPFSLIKKNNNEIYLNTDNGKYLLTFNQKGVYVDSIMLSKKKYLENEVTIETSSLSWKNYGKVRLKNINDIFFDQLTFNFGETNNNENTPSLSLPFCLEGYLNDYFDNPDFFNKKYQSFQATEKLKNYLFSIDYQGEAYDCYQFSSIGKDIQVLLVAVQRGDSTYYLIVTIYKNDIRSHLLVGSIGNDNPIYFCIEKNQQLLIKINNRKESHSQDQWRIQSNGEITKIK